MSASFALLIAAIFLVTGHGQAVPMRWCTISDKETNKCNDFKNVSQAVATSAQVTVEFSCVQGSDAEDCMKKIKNGDADLITLDGGEIKTAGTNYDMVPIVGENYGYGFRTSYKAVAVVKKNTDITFKKLEGKKSCHTGAGKTAGWNVPVGTLLREKLMTQDKSCNAYVSAGKFFSESCVPSVRKVDQKSPENLCGLCKDECTQNGKYSNYAGAFKCLEDGVGQVAFVKHTTVPENAANPSEYLYLCLNGSRAATPDDCYLAIVPAHAVMIKSASSHNSVYTSFLVKASELYGVNQTNGTMFQLFDSSKYDGKDLLFKDSTKSLDNIEQGKNKYNTWLGQEYLDDLDALEQCPTPTGGSKSNKPHSVVAMVSFVAMVLSLPLFN